MNTGTKWQLQRGDGGEVGSVQIQPPFMSAKCRAIARSHRAHGLFGGMINGKPLSVSLATRIMERLRPTISDSTGIMETGTRTIETGTGSMETINRTMETPTGTIETIN